MTVATVSDAPTRVWALPERPEDREAIDDLIMNAFGPGRFAKTAERLREGSTASAGFVFRDKDRVIGSVRLWPISIGDTRAFFLGPIAVDSGRRGGQLGAELILTCLDHAQAAEMGGVLLVGDPAYFNRFGFKPAQGVILPGPVDQRRVLWRETGVESVVGPVKIGR